LTEPKNVRYNNKGEFWRHILRELAIEEYLESIGTLEEQEIPVRTSSLAELLEVSPASVSEMLRRLSDKGLVEYTPYEGACLTSEGRERVQKLTRRHRLWEVFLHQYLGLGWEDVYEDACNLEHATSDAVAAKMAEFLGNPEMCPHGGPIPREDGQQTEVDGITLNNLSPGQEALVIRVINERSARMLHYLSDSGLVIGARVKLLEKSPFDGILSVRVNNIIKAIGPGVASFIVVKPL
jgi:DtxR family Mn-dependent transcriptional regulator